MRLARILTMLAALALVRCTISSGLSGGRGQYDSGRAESGNGGADGGAGSGGTGAEAGSPGDAGEAGPCSTETGACDGSVDASPVTYSELVRSDFPAMYFRLDESTGPTARDFTGDNYTGTYPDAGVTFSTPGAIAGDPDTAVTFDGVHAISVGPSFPFTGTAPFTIEFWAKQTAYEAWGFTVDHEDWGADGGRTGWDVILANSSVEGERFYRDTTSGSHAGTDGGLPLGDWHYIVVTFDGSTMCMYIDGAAVECNSAAGSPIGPSNVSWTIGAPHNGDVEGFVGAMDEFALYTHALTAAQVAAHYAKGKGL